MPTITATPVKAYAHCRNPLCVGYEQVEVDGLREVMAYTYAEMGGDDIFANFTQNSVVEYKFADAGQAPCPGCGAPREVAGDPRPSYQRLSGHDPNGLLNLPKFDAAKQNAVVAHVASGAESDAEMEVRLRQQLKEEAMMAKLRAEIGGEIG